MTKFENSIEILRATGTRQQVENARRILNEVPGGELVPYDCITESRNGQWTLKCRIRHFQSLALATA